MKHDKSSLFNQGHMAQENMMTFAVALLRCILVPGDTSDTTSNIFKDKSNQGFLFVCLFFALTGVHKLQII